MGIPVPNPTDPFIPPSSIIITISGMTPREPQPVPPIPFPPDPYTLALFNSPGNPQEYNGIVDTWRGFITITAAPNLPGVLSLTFGYDAGSGYTVEFLADDFFPFFGPIPNWDPPVPFVPAGEGGFAALQLDYAATELCELIGIPPGSGTFLEIFHATNGDPINRIASHPFRTNVLIRSEINP